MSTEKKYSIIYADPAWSYSDKNCNGACLKHYKTMTLQEIKDLPIKDMSAKDCVLFIWITYPMLKEGLEVIESWGFKYKSIGFQWIKLNKKNNKEFYGLGRWTRGNTEACFIATKGKPKRINNSVFQIIKEPIGRHSEKPHKVREEIVKLIGNLPRIELFSRNRVEGWDSWGNETDKFEEIKNSQRTLIEKVLGGTK
jgi:N6-adenosine-specific RNA methylase IME4